MRGTQEGSALRRFCFLASEGFDNLSNARTDSSQSILLKGISEVLAFNKVMKNLALEQLCPKCNAKAGENCKTNDGTVLRGVHSERWPRKYPQQDDPRASLEKPSNAL